MPNEREGPENRCAVRSYEENAGIRFSTILSLRGSTENDAILYFDEVKVPWERVFALRDPEVCRALFHTAPGHAMQNYQSMIRLMVKMRFFWPVSLPQWSPRPRVS